MSAILFEPFKIKTVEQLPFSTPDERARWIADCHYNVFSLRSDQVTIDLLTDSGTAAMSDRQWAAMMQADEAYAGSRDFVALQQTVRDLTGMENVMPVHQGRAAEHLLFSILVKPGAVVPSNGFFDTTAANVRDCGGRCENIPIAESKDPFMQHPFKGNIDLAALEGILKREGEKIPFVLMTITNNTGGGQPVSLGNLEAVAALAKRFGKKLVLDACRFAENSYFIKLRDEPKYHDLSPRDIARCCFGLCDVVLFSGKKDALANIGGLLVMRDGTLADEVKNKMILVEGYPTYGGLAGYSIAAMNQGLHEVLDERYLKYRLRTISWMVERLAEKGVPVLQPAGGHAIYIEAARFAPHLKRENLPGIALTSELYIKAGVRGCELGTVAFGYRDESGKHVFPELDLVRLALPRRVYTEAHMGYVVEALGEIYAERNGLPGYEFLEEYPVLRHFRSKFRRL